MEIDVKEGAGVFLSPIAILEFPVDSVLAIGCSLSFWYHIYDNETHTSSDLKVKTDRGSNEEELLIIKESNTNGWKNATVFIGNQPAGFKIQFVSKRPFQGQSYIKLDDILFNNCAESDIPPGSDQLSCDFEKNTCSWYHDYTSSLQFERKEQEFGENPEITGYHMLIKTEYTNIINSTARLVSYPQSAKHGLCVSFWYHIFGNSIGSLKFIAKHPGENETVMWLRTGTQGNKWRFADLTFQSDKPIQFIFEATIGGRQGSISFDDIVVSKGSGGSCPAERECTFQGSLCGLQSVGDSGWVRVKGSSLPTNASGPPADHTLGTDQGYYLSSQLWSHTAGSKVSVTTAMMEPTSAEGECLMFWYHMEGQDDNRLNVYLQNNENQTELIRLWRRQGDQGPHWRHGRVTLNSPHEQFKVIFEAVAGLEAKGDVAIDDLIVLNDACPPKGFCDFEMDLCGWANSLPAESGLYWDWLFGDSEGNSLLPPRDHSFDSKFGHFAFFTNTKANETARLESEVMEAVDKACLEIWHYSNGWLNNRLSDFVLTALIKENGSLRSLWSTNGFLNSSWILGRADYTASGHHQIVLEATCPKPDCGSISLDDVHIIRDVSCSELIPTTPAPTPTILPPPSTTAAPSPTTPPPASAMDCTFEQGLCSWALEEGSNVNWTLSNGLDAAHPWDGPQFDHTIGNNQGFFLLLNGSSAEGGESASISAPVFGVSSEFCVEFWFYMSGPAVLSLNLLIQTKSSELLVWTQEGTQDRNWIKSQVDISNTDIEKLIFTANRGTNSKGFTALDDITVKSGVCRYQNVCGFDSGWCGYEKDVSHVGQWSRTKATQADPDHTYRTEHGFYMSANLSSSSPNKVAQLLTHKLPAAAEMCVRFWYQSLAEASNALAVHLYWSGELHEKLWESPGRASTGWEVAEVTVWAPAKFHVVFKASSGPGMTSTVKIDDVSINTGACSPRGSCDFESGQCTWISHPIEGGHDWVLSSGGKLGPSTDHTTHTIDGVFLLSSPQHLSYSSKAQVESEWILPQDAVSCLSFWSFMGTSDSGTLRLHVQTGLTEENITLNINSTPQEWTKFSHSLEINSRTFQLLIEAETQPTGYIAIDDISVKPGLCHDNESATAFVGCSFENGTCGWTDESTGQFKWVRGRNGSGPSVDNTLGNELGWYMAVKENRVDHESPAALFSPLMQQASANCTLHFYYNIYTKDKSELNVFLQSGLRTTLLWWGSGNHGDQWHDAQLTVGRVPVDFRVLFEARISSVSGHIAIDDIGFSSCSLSEPQLSCPETMFTCSNRACVELSRVCDFSDDCGDQSDEIDCEVEGVTEGCSFENGLCFWANNMADTHVAKWTLHTGQGGWPDLGPPRDHTKNSAAGHYITPSSLNDQVSEILSRTLLPSTNCRVRLFYYSLSDVGGNLTVRSRTQRNAQDDFLTWSRGQKLSYSWERAEATFSTTTKSKVVFHYERAEGSRGIVAVDDVSFSAECRFDPVNSELPDAFTTAAPQPSSSTAPDPTTTSSPVHPCQEDEFHCWMSVGTVCVKASAQCNYHKDCPQGEDEHGCGPCTFEEDQCGWIDISDAQTKWKRQKSSSNTVPSTDHTTQTGFFMKVDLSDSPPQTEARLQSPALSPSSSYCQMQFHFYIKAEASGSLRVLMQQEGGSAGGEATLWSRSQSTGGQWSPETLMLGQLHNGFKIRFSSLNNGSKNSQNAVMALDDIAFIDCEKSFEPPALSSIGCSFEDGLCSWLQGAEDNLDWTFSSGPTETPNTGPTGDHTTGNGKYLYLNTSSASKKGNKAQLKSSVLPPAGEHGYCFSFWYHMFGPTVGSMKVFLQVADPFEKTLVWQRSGNHGDQWLLMQSHMTIEKEHQLILEATVGGEAGDVAIDDISLADGPCPVSDVCDFEENSCGWSQDSGDELDWVRQTGSSQNAGPHSDHTTNTATGHYYYLPATQGNPTGQTAAMVSPLYPTNAGSCVQLWYHMNGKEVGTLNIYQRSADEGREVLLFSQTGDQGPLWRSAQATLLPRVKPYRIVVEGVTGGLSEGGIAFDDVHLTEDHCPPPGHCDFETNMCSWTNVGQINQAEWLRGSGLNSDTGPSVDHTTNSSSGHYMYVDSAVGQWGDQSFLISEVFQPSTRGHCITFWYHMFGKHVGTLKLYINDRRTHDAGNVQGQEMWVETGDKGDQWNEANVFIKHDQPFWFVFVYQKGRSSEGDIALDDITIVPFPCYSEPPVDPPDDKQGALTIGLAVCFTLLAVIVISAMCFIFNQKRCSKDDDSMNSELIGPNAFDLSDSDTDGSHARSFWNIIYNPSAQDATSSDV